MKDYASMSDVQVSKAVGDAIGIQWANLDDNYHELCYWPEPDDELRIFDPCNNPADAWPIITDSMISIRPVGDDGQLWEASGMDGMKADYDKNPLRAAMVVFLMMKEDEK